MSMIRYQLDRYKNKPNYDVRCAIIAAELPYWRIAAQLNILESTLNKKFSHEMSDKQKQKIYDAIKELLRKR